MKRRAAVCLTVWIGLCSGCAGREAPAPVPEPVVIRPALCPRPAPPVLPKRGGVSFLESREGYAILKLRDERMRAYLKGLEASLACYEAQVNGEEE